MMTALFKDLRFALRTLARRPGFTVVVVVTLALGIGSNAAIFSVANAVLFRPLPFEDPEELVFVWNRLPNSNVERALVSGPDFLDYRAETTRFAGIAGAFAISGTITGEGRAEEITVAWTSEDLFGVLGVRPVFGRDFTVEDAAPIDFSAFGDPNASIPPGAVILSHGLWQRRFGGDPSAVGQLMQMDGQGALVVGILPPDFRIYLPADAAMPTDVDAWRVIPSNFAENARDAQWLTVVARLKPGVTAEAGQQEMDALSARLREQYQFHANSNMQIVVRSMHQDVVEHARPVLLALLGVVGFVLLIACANVANLLLVRAAAREREIAVRAALGGSRWRIVRQMLTESSVLAVAGAASGLLLAWWGGRILVALRPGNLPRIESVGVDASVVAYTAAATVLAVFVFGLAPALRAASGTLAHVLKERGSDSGGIRGNKIRTALVVSEVALSLILLIGAGLMLRSFTKLQQVDPGYDTENILTAMIPLPFFKYPSPTQRADFFEQLQRRLEVLPGVEAVAGVNPLPLTGAEQYSIGSYGREDVTDEDWINQKADYRAVMPGYTDVMRIGLVAGRRLAAADNQSDALPVAVIDQKLADRQWPGEDPIGKQVLIGTFDVETFALVRSPLRVVGIVEHARTATLAEDGRETVYFPYRLFPWFPLGLTVRSAANPMGVIELVRREVEALDPDVPLADVRLMDEFVADAMAPTRFTLTLILIFAGIALAMAAVGLYGVIAYSVRQRTQEIGVRMAFGAPEQSVVGLVIRQGVTLAAGGVVAGLLGAFFLTRLVSSLLVGVTARDPITFVGIPAILLVVATAASYFPARKALSVDPVEALRGE